MDRRSIHIAAVGSYSPQKVVTNDELSTLVQTSDEWIRSHTGIAKRHLADQTERTSDLAYLAIQDLVQRYSVDINTIDAIIVATATSDYPGFPSTASLLAGRLGISGPAFDMTAACTGFIYALETGRCMIESGSIRRALVVGAEKLSSVVDWGDRNTCVLFGDGAGCILLEASCNQKGIIDTHLASEPGELSLYIDPTTRTIRMDGRTVYTFAVRAIGSTIQLLLERNNLTIDDIAWVVPHQANERIIAACAKRLEIETSKFYLNIAEHANTSAASIPIALGEMEREHLLKPGQLVLLAGFGAGLTYGGTLIRWNI